MLGPNPNHKAPAKGNPQVGYLKNFITNENIIVGNYTYCDGAEDFENNVLYHFPFIEDKLIIGQFCAIAKDVKFIMNGASHMMSGFSTYPFHIFGHGWEKAMPKADELPFKGDTEIGNDVWIGYEVTIMPGVKIGHGAIIGAKSVVTKDIAPYSVCGGNPAIQIKQRFEQSIIDELLRLEWWNWPPEKITANVNAIIGCDLLVLQCAV